MDSRVYLIAQFSPPIHGLSKASETIINSKLNIKYQFIKINITNNKMLLPNLAQILFGNGDVYYFTISQTKYGNARDLIILALLSLKRSKIVVHLHGGYFRKMHEEELNRFQRKLSTILLSKVNACIVLGDSLKYIFEGLVPDERIKVVKNCVDDEYMINETEFAKKMDALEAEKVINVLYLSNLIESKGYKDVLELAKKCTDKNDTRFKFIFAGSFNRKEDEDYFNNFNSENNMRDNVEYKGVACGDEKLKLLSEGHIFILPTRYPREGQPISIIEAMANGQAVLTTEYAGIPDLIRNEENGFFVDYGDVDGMYGKLEYLYENRQELRKICLANRDRVKKQFLQDYYINGIDSVFDEVLNNG